MSLQTELLRASFAEITAREPQLTARFYDILFARYPQLQPMFGRNSRGRQEQMLTGALVAVMDHLENADWLVSTLPALGAKHVAYGVTDEMYDWVGECLLAAMEQASPQWTPELAAAWTAAYGAVAGLMQEGARRELSERSAA